MKVVFARKYCNLAQTGTQCVLIDQESRPRTPPVPAFEGQSCARLHARLNADAPPWPGAVPPVQLELTTIPDATLIVGLDNDGVVLTRQGRIVDPMACFSRLGRERMVHARIALPDGGTIDRLFSGFDAASDNYYHWTVLTRARIGLARALLDPALPVAVPARASGWRDALAGVAGPLLWLEPGLYHVRELLVLWTRSFSPTDILFLDAAHAVLRPARTGSPHRKILISRASNPRLEPAQAACVARMAARHGFETLAPETMSLPDQIAAFADAAIIVGAHGAGLANLVHANHDARVLELNRPLDPGCWLRPWYYQLATGRGLRYAFLDTSEPLDDAMLDGALARLTAAP